MCLQIAEILLLVGGLYALIFGKVRLTRNMVLEGWRARVAGLFLAVPLPLALLAGLLTGLSSRPAGLSDAAQSAAAAIEIVLFVGGVVGAVIFAAATKPKESVEPEEIPAPPAQS